MNRVADSTIKGFLYQFHLTIKSILEADVETKIKVEGIIEDIDIIENNTITAIQCKYHEKKDNYSLSSIYKPILQMLKTFAINPLSDIKFILYAHFPKEEQEIKIITKSDIEDILCTQDIELISKYLVHIKPPKDEIIINIMNKPKKSAEDKKSLKDYYKDNNLNCAFEIEDFLKKFQFIIGESFSQIEQNVKKQFCREGFTSEDIDDLIYPNAIHKIANISINPNESDRIINKSKLISELKMTKKVAISRWTKELISYNRLLKIRRAQLSVNLNLNNRKRYFIFNGKNFDDMNESIVLLLKDFVDMYCHKPKLHEPALFCLIDSNKDEIDNIVSRLHSKQVDVETGYKGNEFFNDVLFGQPRRIISDNWIAFKLRLCFENDDLVKSINRNKPDDLFFISDKINHNYDLKDVNYELLDVKTINELKYLLKITKEVLD